MCSPDLIFGSATGSNVEAPTPTPPPDTSAADAAQTQKAAEELRRNRLKARGRQSTILTSGQGVTSEAPSTRKTLLGQ